MTATEKPMWDHFQARNGWATGALVAALLCTVVLSAGTLGPGALGNDPPPPVNDQPGQTAPPLPPRPRRALPALPPGPMARFQMQQQRQGQGRGAVPLGVGAVGAGEVVDIFVPPDRETIIRFESAQEALQKEEFNEAARLLGGLLEADEDFFFQPDPANPLFRSLKTEADRLIGELPQSGQAGYESLFGPLARQALAQAVKDKSLDQVAAVARKYFHTQAGREAAFILARVDQSQGQSLVAALRLRRLSADASLDDRLEPALSVTLASCLAESGNRAEAEEVLKELSLRAPNAVLRIGAENLKLTSRGLVNPRVVEAVIQETPLAGAATSTDWLLFRGDASRNATSSGGTPLLNERWRVRLANDPRLEQAISQMQAVHLEQDAAVLPSSHPLTVGNYVLARTLSNLQAIDFRTGKRLWEIPTDEPLQEVLDALGLAGQGQVSNFQQVGALRARVWQNATFGTLSSDGIRVFSVEDLSWFGRSRSRGGQVIQPNGRVIRSREGFRQANRLAAHEIETGRLVWEVGGEELEFPLPLSGACFLGPPLPLEDKLYVLAEINREIRLVVLASDTGEELWNQQLAVVEDTLIVDDLFRTAGTAPTYADGILVCPTGAGALVAVDLTTRSLLWAHQYPRLSNFNAQRGGPFGMRPAAAQSTAEEDRGWSDGSMTISQGKVLATPADSQVLFCLDLASGEQLWNSPMPGCLYLAGVADNRVLVVCSKSMTALNLTDGELAWQKPLTLPAGSIPSGRGFLNGTRYYIPLSTSEVACVDVTRGEITARAKSRRGSIPGNLVCHAGSVVSLGTHYLESFFELQELDRQIESRLAANPQDAAALALRGEVLLAENRVTEAADYLSQAYALEPTLRTKDILFEARLLELKQDFAAHQHRLAEMRALASTPKQLASFLQTAAVGFRDSGDLLQSQALLLELPSASEAVSLIERLEDGRSVALERWVAGELAALRERASDDQRQALQLAITAALTKWAAEPSKVDMAKLMVLHGQTDVAAQAWTDWGQKELEAGRTLSAELAFLRGTEAADQQIAGAAWARLAQCVSQNARPHDAARVYSLLARDFADVVCQEGKTGQQLAIEAASNDALAFELEREPLFRGPYVTVQRVARNGDRFRNPFFIFPSDRGPFFDDVRVELDIQRNALIARDGKEQLLWKLPASELGGVSGFPFHYAVLNPARAAGHLLVIAYGDVILAIDTSAVPLGGQAKVAWRHQVIDTTAGEVAVVSPQHSDTVWGERIVRALTPDRQTYAPLAEVTQDYVAVLGHRKLRMLDTTTGAVLWERLDIPQGSDVFGDRELLFVRKPKDDGTLSRNASVYRALDGALLGEREIPYSVWSSVQIYGQPILMRTAGRLGLVWHQQQTGLEIRVVDLWSQQLVWSQALEQNSKASIEGDAVCIFEPSGKFTLRDIASNAVLRTVQLQADLAVSDIHVFEFQSMQVVAVNHPPVANETEINVQNLPGSILDSVVFNGTLYGMKPGENEPAWSSELENLSLGLDYAKDLPIMVMGAQRYEKVPVANRQDQFNSRATCALVCLDVRTGSKLVNEENLIGQIGNLEIDPNPAKQSISILTQRGTYELTFGDTAPPPEADPEKDANGDDPANAGKPMPGDAGTNTERPGGANTPPPPPPLPGDGLKRPAPENPEKNDAAPDAKDNTQDLSPRPGKPLPDDDD